MDHFTSSLGVLLIRAYVVPACGLDKLGGADTVKAKELAQKIVDWTAAKVSYFSSTQCGSVVDRLTSQVSDHKKLRGGVHLIEAIPKSFVTFSINLQVYTSDLEIFVAF